MSRRAPQVPAARALGPTSLSQNVRVIGAPPRREAEGGSSLKMLIVFGVVVAVAAGAATWFLLR